MFWLGLFSGFLAGAVVLRLVEVLVLRHRLKRQRALNLSFAGMGGRERSPAALDQDFLRRFRVNDGR